MKLSGKLERAYSTISKMESEIATIKARVAELEGALVCVRDMMDQSVGVVGFHLNGKVAPWAELERGGKFEEWLGAFSDAYASIKEPANEG